MSDKHLSQVESDRQLLVSAQQKGTVPTMFAFMRLSGPGWLQSAITLGGGSLAGSLYLGVLGGTSFLWLQPMFMILGIVMLSAIGYVAMSTDERPFQAINRHVNPVLGWSWALACLAANMVWCLPQFSLANSVLEQNLAPGLYADTGAGPFWGKMIVAMAILSVTILITWSYGSGHWGLKLYEILLKLMVAVIVICFVSVVWALASKGELSWGSILWGFLPDPTRLGRPAPGFNEALFAVSDESLREFWNSKILTVQFDKMAAAAATAVGINMTFLFPYSILRKGWSREFRGLQVFDLCTGMFIPFVLATSCVVIAAANQFHAKPVPGLVSSNQEGKPTAKELKSFRGIMSARVKKEMGDEAYNEMISGQSQFKQITTFNSKLVESPYSGSKAAAMKKLLGENALDLKIAAVPESERTIAAMLVERDANRLAKSLAPITGGSANYLFGIGVLGMTLSTITLLMLISGFVICEVFNLPSTGWSFRLACLPAAVGALGPFIWSKAGFALAVPTSVFGLMLLPIAYITFFILMNQKSLLKDEMPRGRSRWTWNILMALAAGVATVSSLYMVWSKAREKGLIAIGLLLALVLIVQFYRWARPPHDQPKSEEPTSEKPAN